jgi:hypothetical protein
MSLTSNQVLQRQVLETRRRVAVFNTLLGIEVPLEEKTMRLEAVD